MNKLHLLGLICIFGLVACTPFIPSGIDPAGTALATDGASRPGPILTSTPVEEATAVIPSPNPVDLTAAQHGAIQTLAAKLKISTDQVHLIKSDAVHWPNDCLGVVLPGVICSQAAVAGFQMTLEVNGQQYMVHTNQDGTRVIDASQPLTTIGLVTLAVDNHIQVAVPNISLEPSYNPTFGDFMSNGDAAGGSAYVLTTAQPSQAFVVDAKGAHPLAFIQNPTHGLALWRGGPNAPPRLAWGTQPANSSPSVLQVSKVDGSKVETLLSQDPRGSPRIQLVANSWSADGQSLYFSKEPVGLDGYTPFAGASSLYRIDISTKKVSELIPLNPDSGPFNCLDAVTGDYRFVADHCTLKTITIRDLSLGTVTNIQPPIGVLGWHILGSARFSPDGSRVAFSLAKGDPNAELGWLAVSDGRSGTSKAILAGPAGLIFTVKGWLNDQALLVQVNVAKCSPGCASEMWVVGINGSSPVKVADGSFLTVMDNP